MIKIKVRSGLWNKVLSKGHAYAMAYHNHHKLSFMVENLRLKYIYDRFTSENISCHGLSIAVESV